MTAETIPLNALARHFGSFRGPIAGALLGVVDSGHFVLGGAVRGFESAFAAYCGVDHCVGVANGTDALELALKATGTTAGARVVLAANAGMYATTAVLACGAEPVFADVLDDGTPDPAAFAAAAAASAPAAMVATHLYGRLARIDALAATCTAAGIALVEDCAQAHGARAADGRRAGAFGDAAAFSFYPTKNLGAIGDGGAVATRDAAVADRLRALRQYGWSRKYECAATGGRNSRLDELQAAVLSVALPALDGWNARRRAIADRYAAGIRHPAITLPAAAGEAWVAHLYVVACERRDALRAHLAAAGVASDVHYPVPDHRQPAFAGRFDHVSLPVTERLARTILTLPCFPELDDDEVDAVIDACNRF